MASKPDTINMHDQHVTRRSFIQTTSAVLAGAAVSTAWLPSHAALHKNITAAKLPRWRGFNLLEKFTNYNHKRFMESDFEWMSEWGFDFARLPLSYHCWADPKEWFRLNEETLKHIDEAVEFGRKHAIHVNLNFHRAPGYCVNPPEEPLDLFKDAEALKACAFHWAHFAKRYEGIPNEQLSFDLLNEPKDLPEADYSKVVEALVEAIRKEDPKRLIIADGLRWGTKPVPSLAKLGIGQSTRGYEPMRISHHKASWISGSDQWPEPAWPLTQDGKTTMDKETLRRTRIEPWQALEKLGVGVHVGEWGAFNKTPHAVALAWMRDCLSLWKDAGWGWALWNFRGSFGILDSEREGVSYENFHGHKLDRTMLDLLRQDQ